MWFTFCVPQDLRALFMETDKHVARAIFERLQVLLVGLAIERVLNIPLSKIYGILSPRETHRTFRLTYQWVYIGASAYNILKRYM